MGLSRGGGVVAFQKVVSKVSDLPSPLDAEPGQRIIVRETEEVYGLNSTTRMWEVIGTLKRVGGKKPEELAAHVDSKGNPHGTSLQDVLDVGTTVKVSQEIVLNGNGPASQIRLMSGGSALRVGPDAGSKDGVLWMNVGAGRKTFLRAVNADGDDMLVLSTDGIVSGGSATFKSYKGLAEFEDEIVANEGVMSAPGFDLVLAGDKGVLFKVGGQEAALLTDKGLVLKRRMGLTVNDLSLTGQVAGDLIPSKQDSRLGAPAARWAASLTDLDVVGQLTLRVAPNSQKPAIKVTGDVPGDAVVLTAGGELGLGTVKPEARLDVRGEALIDSGLRLTKNSVKSGDWATIFGAELTIVHKGTVLLRGQADGTTVLGATKVQGDLTVAGELALGGVAGLEGQSILFNGGAAAYKAASHSFTGPVKVATDAARPLEVPGFSVEGGNVKVAGAVYADSMALDNGLTISGMALTSGKVTTPGDFEVDAKTLVAQDLRLLGGTVEIPGALRLKTKMGSATFAMRGPICGLSFEGRRWEVDGITKLTADEAYTKQLNVEGGASFCSGQATISERGLHLTSGLNVGGLAFKKVVEELELNGDATATKFELPEGVRVEAVLVQLKSDVTGPRFLQVGERGDVDRFATPVTDMKAGTTIRGLAHWDRGRAVQKTKGPIVVAGDAPATGKVSVTVYYVDPAAF